jgi:two-component system, OmpR family, sensor histidine kinase VicK
LTGLIVDSEKENTLVLYGEDNVVKVLQHFFSRISKTSRLVIDAQGLPSIVRVKEYNLILEELVSRGIKRMCLTEVTRENLEYCRELSKIIELRHLDGIKGNFAVSETEYVASAILNQTKPIAQVIYSSAVAMVEQHQYLFETLWSKAIPAEQKIAEMESGLPTPVTEILHDPVDIAQRIRLAAETSKWLNVCASFDGMRRIRLDAMDSIRALVNLQERGSHAGVRWIGTISEQDIEVIEEFVSTGVQVRHLPSIPLHFGVTDKECNFTVSGIEHAPASPSMLISNEKPYISHFNALFEEIWVQGIDASDRVAEIREGVPVRRTEVIRRPTIIQRTLLDLIANAKQEILILVPTENAYRREGDIGVFELIKNAAGERAVNVRILAPFDRTTPILDNVGRDRSRDTTTRKIQVRRIEKISELETTLLLTDRKESLVINLKDDQKEDFLEAIGAAVYSDSDAMVTSYASIFESLWRESELSEEIRRANELLQVNDKLQKEFINIAAHELKTPVQPLLVLAELLDSEVSGREEVSVKKADIELIARNARRLERLTSDILDISRIESSTLKLQKSRVDLDDVMQSVLKDVKNRPQKSTIHYSSKKIIIDSADRDRIVQVIMNLVDNALKFTTANSGEIFIETKTHNGEAIVSVTDTGPGIDSGIMPRLFTKFASKSENGTGLGLYISKVIVEAHGGKIWANNRNPESPVENSRGAIFAFSVPMNS